MSKFKAALDSGEFAISTEVGPPKGVSMDSIYDELKCLKGRVHAINVTDQQSAVMRLGSIAAGAKLNENGFEPICQVTCRDRNRIALQSDLLSAYFLGIRNILIMTGDKPGQGDHPDAKAVYDLDSVELLHAVKELQSGRDMAGNELESSPDFFVGAVVNPGADPLDVEIGKMEGKVKEGARFFQTQAIFDPAVFEKFIKSIKSFRSEIKILGGIVPIRSVKAAKYMNAHIPGVDISDALIKRLEGAEDTRSEAVSISAGTISEIKDMCDGIHIMPIRDLSIVPEILDAAGI